MRNYWERRAVEQRLQQEGNINIGEEKNGKVDDVNNSNDENANEDQEKENDGR